MHQQKKLNRLQVNEKAIMAIEKKVKAKPIEERKLTDAALRKRGDCWPQIGIRIRAKSFGLKGEGTKLPPETYGL